ncbi:pif6 [Hemileuca sp. nucleopolyhedrovirus]|uniref:Pif6 n=1 Tax=Hemileuca sp. nucleopolyhedrovirus TaxID=1367203 RepID=S5N377_9ABAC|nr:pif6 [Hemileuca sp. nucleopolyhedrovirus]AGR56815.1 pif6 [Hemileuca sp. nucleopolyhedrovirus]
MVKWRMLNSDRVEVTPEDRKDAWQELIVDILTKSPRYATFRTMINRANFESFDYKRPIVYEISSKTLLINNEFVNKALNRPRTVIAPFKLKSFQIVLAFICAILITLIAAFVFNTPETISSLSSTSSTIKNIDRY